MMKQQDGFGIIGVVIVIAILSILGLATWQFMTKKNGSSTSNKQASTQSTTEKKAAVSPAEESADTTKEFKDDSTNISFRYPAKWQLSNLGDPDNVGYLTNVNLKNDKTEADLILSIAVRSKDVADGVFTPTPPFRDMASAQYLQQITSNGSSYALLGLRTDNNANTTPYEVFLAKCNTEKECYAYIPKGEGSFSALITDKQGHGKQIDTNSNDYEQMKAVISSLKF